MKNVVTYFEPSTISMMKPFCENSSHLKAFNYFRKKSSIVDVRPGSNYTSGRVNLRHETVIWSFHIKNMLPFKKIKYKDASLYQIIKNWTKTTCLYEHKTPQSNTLHNNTWILAVFTDRINFYWTKITYNLNCLAL